jgi:Flp pilus assembly protein CpaB
MRGRLLILIGLILLLVLVVAGFFLFQGGLGGTPAPVDPNATGVVDENVPQEPTATLIPFVNVVRVVQNIPRGYRFPDNIEELLSQGVVDYFPWPESALPFNALTEEESGLEEVLGKVARVDLFREQPLLSNYLVDDLLQLGATGSDAAALLPSDRVAVTIPIDRVTSVGYAIQPGDRVDILLSMLFVDVDEIFQTISPNSISLLSVAPEGGGFTFTAPIPGRPEVTTLGQGVVIPSENQRPRLVTQRTIQNAIVVHVGDFPLDGRLIGEPPTPTPVPAEQADDGDANTTPPPPPTPIPPPDIVTLGVSPQEAVMLTWAIEARLPLSLALRSVTNVAVQLTEPVTLDYVMSTYAISVPARRDYTIEPAIRSIRRLLAGEEIQLNSGTSGAAGG